VSTRDQLRRYVAMASDMWTPRETTDARTDELYQAIRDEAYREGYATGRSHSGADGWVLDQFSAVFTTSDGGDRAVGEVRCNACRALMQGVGPQTLIDLMALAARHECKTPRKDGRS
jgi:hypothetical protein